MAIRKTTLATILNRMNRYQVASTTEETYKVRDIDEAIRTQRREVLPPWVIKQTTISLFKDVLIYPVASDHEQLAFIDRQLEDGTDRTQRPSARFVYTSLKDFYEDDNFRNKLCEIWDGGDKFIGARYNNLDSQSAKVSSNTVSDWTASDDASGLTAETVNTIDNENTIKVTVTYSAGTATLVESAPTVSDSDYKKKYYFRWLYMPATVPTSVELRYGNDSSAYLSQSVTTQHSGRAFKANSWNLLAMDLDTATTTGTITATAFDYSAIIITETVSGTYYIGPAYLRRWHKLDYWYYSRYNVMTSSATELDQEYFFDSSDSYSTSDQLVGEDAWIDVITFDALLTTLGDQKDSGVISMIVEKRKEAWMKFIKKYPDMSPVIVTRRLQFGTNHNREFIKGNAGR